MADSNGVCHALTYPILSCKHNRRRRRVAGTDGHNGSGYSYNKVYKIRNRIFYTGCSAGVSGHTGIWVKYTFIDCLTYRAGFPAFT